MKKVVIGIMALAALAVMVDQLAAQDSETPDKPARIRSRDGVEGQPESRPARVRARDGLATSRPRGPADDDGKRIFEAVKQLNLTDEQAPKVRAILQEQGKLLEEWRTANQGKFEEITAQIQEARKAGDREKLQQLQKQRQELLAGRKALHDSFMAKLDEVLTDEQMAKLKELIAQRPMPLPRIRAALANLGLTPQQKTQVEEILKAAQEQAKDQTPEARAEALKKAWEKIQAEVLTDEQRAKLAKTPVERPDDGAARMERRRNVRPDQPRPLPAQPDKDVE